MDHTLRGHGASHEAHKLQLRTVLRYGPHRLIGDLTKERKEKEREKNLEHF